MCYNLHIFCCRVNTHLFRLHQTNEKPALFLYLDLEHHVLRLSIYGICKPYINYDKTTCYARKLKNIPAEWLMSASLRVLLLSTFCRCQSSAGCLPCGSVLHFDKRWNESKAHIWPSHLAKKTPIYQQNLESRWKGTFYKFNASEKLTYSVLSAARHDVFELDFWHVVVVDGSWQVTDYSHSVGRDKNTELLSAIVPD